MSNLELLNWSDNQLTTLNLLGFPNLKFLYCAYNNISSINLSGYANLTTFYCNNNNLINLNLSNLPLLDLLLINNNPLTTINFSRLPRLKSVYCSYTLINSMDFNYNPFFDTLSFGNNPNLTTIKIKNNKLQTFDLTISPCPANIPNLSYICADSYEIADMQNFLTGCGVTQTITYTTDCVLGVEDFESSSFKIYPNPTTSKVFFDNNNTQFEMVTVYNTFGQVVYNQKLDYLNAQVVNFDTFAQGVYLLKFSDNSKIIYKSIIKQ